MKIQNFLNKDTLKKLKSYTIMILLLMIGRVIVGSHNLLLDNFSILGKKIQTKKIRKLFKRLVLNTI